MANDREVEALALSAIDHSYLVDELGKEGVGPKRVPFSWIYSYVCDREVAPPDTFKERLRDDPLASRNLEALSSKMARAEIGVAAAASTQINERLSDSATLQLIEAERHPGQIFIKIQLSDTSCEAVSILLVIDSSENWHRLDLVPYSDGASQGIAEMSSPIVTAIRDPGSTIRLC